MLSDRNLKWILVLISMGHLIGLGMGRDKITPVVQVGVWSNWRGQWRGILCHRGSRRSCLKMSLSSSIRRWRSWGRGARQRFISVNIRF